MNSAGVLAGASSRAADDAAANARYIAPGHRMNPGAAQGVALWVFIAVLTSLFSLFLFAYVMRLSANDATAIALPWQLWLSSAVLLGASVQLQRASALSRRGQPALSPLLAGGAGALVFIAIQGMAWQALLAAQVSLTGNPAGSFFYLLTALHGLHVAGGVVAWALVWRHARRSTEAAAWRIALCARYWHFLLLLWAVLFTAFRLITPELAATLCGTR